MLDITEIQQYSHRYGPLPKPSSDPVAHSFWKIYNNPLFPENLWGAKGSVLWNAAKAGYDRHKAEPGIDPSRDFRVIYGHPLKLEIQFEMRRGDAEYVGNIIEGSYNSFSQIEDFVANEIPKQESPKSEVDAVYVFAIGQFFDAEGIATHHKLIGTYDPYAVEWEWQSL